MASVYRHLSSEGLCQPISRPGLGIIGRLLTRVRLKCSLNTPIGLFFHDYVALGQGVVILFNTQG